MTGRALCVIALALTVLPSSLLMRVSIADGVRPSAIIYPAPKATIRFSHPRHASTPCRTCHAGVWSSSSAGDRSLPTEAACAPCHLETRRTAGEDRSRCALCHPGFSGEGVPLAFLYPTARLRFGHRLHLDKGSQCGDCHRFEKAGERPLPRMSGCLACHQRQRAPQRCVACHLSEKDGRMTTHFGSGRLQPQGSLRGDLHGPLFSRSHAAVARMNRSYCESCHQQASCLRCHNGTLRPQRIHPNDYASLHALEARRDETRCRSCHSLQTFCVGCHQRSGVGVETSRSGFRPDTSRSFHPEGFSSLQVGPAHHAYAARRNGNTCLSCHREATCVRCHGSRARGLAGFSPHPAGFAASAQCRTLAGRASRACSKCHLPGDSRATCQ